jgi:hypothetical protein
MHNKNKTRWFPKMGDVVMLPVTSKSLFYDKERKFEIGLVIERDQRPNTLDGALWKILLFDGLETVHIHDISPLFDKEGEWLQRPK